MPQIAELTIVANPQVYEFAINHDQYADIYLAVHNTETEGEAIELVSRLIADVTAGRLALELPTEEETP